MVMKVISYTALLYGVEYLEWAIRSVIDHVDEHHTIYSPIGAHGHRTDIPCPETREQLYEAAVRGAGNKLRWHDAGPFHREGHQRDSIHTYAPDADVILVLDADEVWSDGLAENMIAPYRQWQAEGKEWIYSRVRVPMVHYWRSFHRAIIHDPAYPERVIFPKVNGTTITADRHYGVINHFGYAQTPRVIEYKQHTHGHKGEWRKDDWFNTVFMANAQTNTHPVGSEYWDAEPVNPLDYMPSWMQEHAFYGLEVIE